MRLAVVHGPNLNLLGTREPEMYGRETLDQINAGLRAFARSAGAELVFFQSNHEGALIDFIQELYGRCDGIVINAGGLTHSSVSLRDALLGVGIPFIEVHLTNPFSREPMRHVSTLTSAAGGLICGLGPIGYELGLRALLARG